MERNIGIQCHVVCVCVCVSSMDAIRVRNKCPNNWYYIGIRNGIRDDVFVVCTDHFDTPHSNS